MMFRGLNPAQHAAQHARIVFLLNEALHVAFTSYNTACLLYKQTGAQRADGAVGVSLPPPCCLEAADTKAHTQFIPQVIHKYVTPPEAQRNRHRGGERVSQNVRAHHKTADTQNARLAGWWGSGDQHPVLLEKQDACVSS